MARHASFSAAAAASVDSPFFTLADLAAYRRSPSLKACRRWLERNPGCPREHDGRLLRFRRSLVCAFLELSPSQRRAANLRAGLSLAAASPSRRASGPAASRPASSLSASCDASSTGSATSV
jgi:hypothetical protein